MQRDRGYTDQDLSEVSDNPESTKDDFARARPFAEVFPDLAASLSAGIEIVRVAGSPRLSTEEKFGMDNNEMLRAVKEYAGKITWKNPDLQILDVSQSGIYSSLALSLQDKIISSHSRGKLMLPDLTAFGNESVFVFSDYAGEGSGDYNTYSFLLCAWNLTGAFAQKMIEIRDKHGLGAKEIAFKDFRMGQMQRALPEYLDLLDSFVNGFLFTLIVDKRVGSFFGSSESEGHKFLSETLSNAGLGNWGRGVAEKLVRITHVAAFLTSLLVENDQKVLWMTDNDAICANEEIHKQTLKLYCNAIGLYAGEGSKNMKVGGAVPFRKRDLATLDLLSATDVVASSVEHYLTRKDASTTEDFLVKGGSNKVLQWLGHDGIALKKMNVIVRAGPNGEIQSGNLEFRQKDTPANVIQVPIVV